MALGEDLNGTVVLFFFYCVHLSLRFPLAIGFTLPVLLLSNQDNCRPGDILRILHFAEHFVAFKSVRINELPLIMLECKKFTVHFLHLLFVALRNCAALSLNALFILRFIVSSLNLRNSSLELLPTVFFYSNQYMHMCV